MRNRADTLTLERILSSLLKSGDEVIELLTPAAEEASHIVTISTRIDAEIALSTNTSVQSLADENTKSMSWLRAELKLNDEAIADLQATIISQHGETMDRLDSIADQLSHAGLNNNSKANNSLFKASPLFQRSLHVIRAVDAFQGRSKDYDRLKVLDWLSLTPYSRHHKTVHEGVLDTTGSWFLNDDEYTKWRDGKGSSILWFHGPPGSGKSNLT